MTSDTTFTVEPTAAHTHTVIFLHGRVSNGEECAAEFLECEASEPEDQPRALLDLFPTIKWVFPSAPITDSHRYATELPQWFDMWSLEKPKMCPELQEPGLVDSIDAIVEIIAKEETFVPREKIFLAGISQGFATAIAAFLTMEGPTNFAALIGLCSWMPEPIREVSAYDWPMPMPMPMPMPVTTVGPPIFLSHSADDDVVPIENGRELRDLLRLRHHEVEWIEYEDGGHWVNEPQGVDDLANFIRRNMV